MHISDIQTLIVSGAVGAIVGGTGITGLIFYFMRRYIEKMVNAKDTEEKRRKDQRIERMNIDDKLWHCQGRLFFWMHKAIVTGMHNGDLEKSFEDYQKAEEEKKNLDRKIIIETEYK
jgi:hypothetical protein